MNRTPRPSVPRALATCARALLACVWVLLLVPSVAQAVTPYSLEWVDIQAPGSCLTADLGQHDGGAFFKVNQTPLPTYQVPGALVTNADGSESNRAEAGFDSVLLRTGPNDFFFGVQSGAGDDSCVHAREIVHLVSVPLGIDKPLFDVVRDGTAFVGSTQMDLSLAEINPPLAQDIVNLEAALTAERKTLFSRATEVGDLAAHLDLLKQLDAELHDLVNRPLDEITQEDLDAILDKYGDVIDPATRAAVEQLLADVQKSIEDLHEELASLVAEFGAQADATADLVTATASASGYDPEDPWGYTLGASDVPPVAIPDVSGVPGAFDPGNDPYDAYAQAVIEALAEDVVDGEVTARGDFVAQVRAWRANDKAIGAALAASMNVSQAETSAFLNAENKVRAYVLQFMNAQGWFNDSTVPADVRATVDGVLKNKFDVFAEQMKDALNILGPDEIDLTDTRLFKSIVAFGGAMSALNEDVTPYTDMMVTLVQASERIAIGFVPFVGATLDFCEAVTGRAWCMKDGAELSTEERIFSGAGVAVGSVATFWAGVKGAGIGAKGAAVAGAIATVPGDVAEAMHAERLAAKFAAKGFQPGAARPFWKTLPGAITSKLIDAFEEKGIKLVQSRAEIEGLLSVGDDGFRGTLKKFMTAADKAPDVLAVTKNGKLAIIEVKGGKKILAARTQLQSGLVALEKAGYLGDIDYVEIIIWKDVLPFDDAKNWIIKDGYFFDVLENKRVSVKGFPNIFIRATEAAP